MNLCLCPNCASTYRAYRNSESLMRKLKNDILSVHESDVTSGDQVVMEIEDRQLWFTQTHFAEIQELLRLESEVSTKALAPNPQPDEEHPDEKVGLSVYSAYVGKHIRRKRDGFFGEITKIDEQYLRVNVEQGEKAGKTTQIELKFFIQSINSQSKVYEIVD